MIDSFQDVEVFSKALVYSVNAPLKWQRAQVPAKDLDADNEQCLRTLLSLSEHHNVDVDEAFTALERKVVITLEMVAMLLKANIDMPSSKALSLGAHEISWQQTNDLHELDAKIEVVMYLHDLYPKPLVLSGQVKLANVKDCRVALSEHSDEVQQFLEKFIFLHHRRAIALAKKS